MAKSSTGVLTAAVPAVFLAVFFLLPLFAVITTGLRPSGVWQADAIGDVLSASRTWRLLGFTAAQALMSTAATLALGLPLAFVLARYRFAGAAMLRSLVVIPFVLPTVVVGAAFLVLIGPRGALGIDLTGTVWALIAAHVFLNVAIVVRTVGALLGQLDPRAEDAARALGATRWRAFRTVTLPLVAPAIVAASVVVTLFCFTSFGIVQILGAGELRTLEVEIYRTTAFDLDLAAAAVLALLQLACVVALLVVVERLQKRRDVAQRMIDPRLVQRAPRGSERIGVIAIAIAGAALIVAPLVVLVLRSFRIGTTWTLQNWVNLFTDNGSTAFVDPARAVATSLSTAVVAATMAVIIGGMAAVAMARRGRGRGVASFDAVLMLPLGTSAVTVGLGLFLALDQPPLDLRDSWWLVPIAQALVAVPFVVRVLLPVLRGFDQRYLDAARMLGASFGRARRTIEWPAMRAPVVVAAGFAFAISLGEFGATVFLARADAPTLPVAVARLLGRPGESTVGQAYAASVLLLIVTAVVVLLVDRVRTTRLGEF